MSALTYPYLYKRIDFGRIFNPLVNLSVKAKWGWQPLWFLVDSGADTTMMTLQLGLKLGLSANQEQQTSLFGIGKKRLPAYPGKISLKLGEYEIQTRVYFIKAVESTLLLGRLDIFDRFNITFNSQTQHVVFQPLV